MNKVVAKDLVHIAHLADMFGGYDVRARIYDNETDDRLSVSFWFSDKDMDYTILAGPLVQTQQNEVTSAVKEAYRECFLVFSGQVGNYLLQPAEEKQKINDMLKEGMENR